MKKDLVKTKKANKVTKAKEKDFEIKFYEQLLKQNPNFIEALISLGDAYTRQGFYQEGLAIDKKLITLLPNDPAVRYNLACSLSLTGQVQKAFGQLKKAILLGYDQFAHMLNDPDLKNVRKLSEFTVFSVKLKRLKKPLS